MQKLFFSLTLLIILIISTIYIGLFTTFGNGLVASFVESRVNETNDEVKLKVEKFVLTTKNVELKATISDSSKIELKGNFSILDKTIDLIYNVDVKELSNLENLITQRLNGSLNTNGVVKGDEKLILVSGISDIAGSNTKYDVSLINFELSTVKLNLKNAKIDKLLYLVNQPVIAKGILNIDGNINNATFDNLDGNITLKIKSGKLLNSEFNKAYAQTITSNVYFTSDVKANLSPNNVEVNSNFISTLAEVYANKTTINLKDNSINSDYDIQVKKLSLLQSLIGMKLNGSFSTNGNITLANDNINIKGQSDLISSQTTYDVNIENFTPKSVKVDILNAKLEHLFHIIDQPVYSKGDLNLNANITSLDMSNLQGDIKTIVTNAKVVNPVVNTLYELQLKDEITYTLQANTKLDKTDVKTQAKLNSTLANVNIAEAKYDLSKAQLNSDYNVIVSDLSKLYDLAQMKMRGKIEIDGDIFVGEKDFIVNGKSNLLNGNLNYKLKNENLKAQLNDVEVLKFMHMMYYPEIFDSKGSFELNYNLTSAKGKLFGRLVDGTFVKNKFSSLIDKMASYDITKEVYDTTDIYSSINEKVLKSTVNMKNNKSSIDVTQSTLDLTAQTVDALIDVKLPVLKTKVKVKGKLESPSISLASDKKDIKETIKNSYENNKDKVEENLKKVLKDKVDKEKAKDLIKNFKSLF